MIVEGPPMPRFRDLENALREAVYGEATRLEKRAADLPVNP